MGLIARISVIYVDDKIDVSRIPVSQYWAQKGQSTQDRSCIAFSYILNSESAERSGFIKS